MNNVKTILLKDASHNDWGEAWVICKDCGARLYSQDGYRDIAVRCPNREECSEN